VCHTLLVVSLVGISSLDSRHCLLHSQVCTLIGGFERLALLEGIYSFMVLLHYVVDVSFDCVGLGVVSVKFDCLVNIGKRRHGFHQFEVAATSVTVVLSNSRSTGNGLVILLNGSRERSYFEELISSGIRFLSEFWILVC